MSGRDPILLATTIFVLQEGGNYKQFHRGEAVPGLNEEQVERLTKCGALGTAADVEPAAPESASAEAPAATDGGDKPDEDANKPELVEWVFNNVAKADGSDYTKSELTKMRVDELRDLIESVSDED